MHVVAHRIGYPRIGPNRELKWELELVGSAVDDFFLDDEVLETALMLGVRPAGVVGTAFDLLTALTRGTLEREA